jgi:hypothetical protein
MKLAGCYKATVNESETITEAKVLRAFSSEVGTGSREENASKQG